MKTYKAIEWAYPTSKAANRLGFPNTGCYFVQLRNENIEGCEESQTFIPHDAEGFDMPDDPDLISLFHEYAGELCPMFLQYGNLKALRALNLVK